MWLCKCVSPLGCSCGMLGLQSSESIAQQMARVFPATFSMEAPKHPHICPVCVGKGEQKIENPYSDNEYCSKCIRLYLDRAKDSSFWSAEVAINRISDCESCKEIVKNTPMMKPCIACKGACVLWG